MAGNKVYILGGAQTDFERNWTKEGKGIVALLKEVVTDGLENAGLSFDDVIKLNRDNRVACFVGNFIAAKYTEQGHLGAFLTEVDEAFYGVPSARYEAACASGSHSVGSVLSSSQSIFPSSTTHAIFNISSHAFGIVFTFVYTKIIIEFHFFNVHVTSQ